HRGMPQVDVSWTCGLHGIERFTVTQHDVINEGGVWPIATEVLLHYPAMKSRDLRLEFNSAKVELNAAIKQPCPDYVFANDQDYAYGRFLLDQESRSTVRTDLGNDNDLFRRTLLWGSLWESVRVAELAPRTYISLAQKLVPNEQDESLTASIIS